MSSATLMNPASARSRSTRRSRFTREAGVLRVREVAASYVTVPRPGALITDTENAAALFFQHFQTATQPQELLMAAYLTSRHALIAVELLYRGTVATATVSSRDMLRSALILNATAVIFAHIHPSGDPAPSVDDERFTHRAIEAGRLVEVDVLDHIVLGFDESGGLRFESMKSKGWI